MGERPTTASAVVSQMVAEGARRAQ